MRKTCDWILADHRYAAWAASDCSDILWLLGKPGSGKSTLLLKLLKESLRSTESPSLQYMLSDFANDKFQVPTEPLPKPSFSHSLNEDNNSSSERKVVVSYFYNFRNKNEMDDTRMLQSILF